MELIGQMQSNPDILWVEPDIYMGRVLLPLATETSNSSQIMPWGTQRIGATGFTDNNGHGTYIAGLAGVISWLRTPMQVNRALLESGQAIINDAPKATTNRTIDVPHSWGCKCHRSSSMPS